jgi:hypothetical protein
VKRNDKSKHSRGASAGRVVRDWDEVFMHLQDAIDWALDIAIKLADGDEEEIEAIERVRGYAQSWLEGDQVDVDMSDVWTTLAILFAAIETDVGIDSSPLLEPLRRYPTKLHLPGAARDERPTVVIRRAPRFRNGGALFTQLAA